MIFAPRIFINTKVLRIMKKAWLFLALILTSPVFAQQVLTPEILWSLKRISDPQLSHDGKTVLFNVRNYSIADNKGNADVYLLNLGNGNVTPLCTKPGNEYAARWAGPDAVSFLGPNADPQRLGVVLGGDGHRDQQQHCRQASTPTFSHPTCHGVSPMGA